MKRLMMIQLLLITIISACSIKAPEVNVTGEKTALEREVLGTYHEMQEDVWMVASARSATDKKTVPISPQKRRVLDALQQQKFNKDDIDEFKRKGYIGENNQGLLEVLPHAKLPVDSLEQSEVKTIVTEENQDREIIISRVIELNQSLKNAVRESILAVFAQMHQDNSSVGTWIQNKTGEWIQK